MGKFKQNQIEVTKVIFRKFKDGDIIALFPELPGDNKVSNCMSYMRIGQHGSKDANTYTTKPAKPEEYQALYKELQAIGYRLKIVSRISYEMDQKRIKAIRAYNTISSDNVDDYLPGA